MEDKNTAFDLQKVLHCCFTIQTERIRKALLYEATLLNFLPDLHRELLALAKIAQLISSQIQRPSSPPAGADSSEGPPSPTAVREEIANLDAEDRHLLREAVEELLSNLGQLKANKEDRATINLGEHINDKTKSSGK
jgi:hypothetical protein